VKHVFRTFAEETRAHPDAVARVEARLEPVVADRALVQSLLSELPAAPVGAEARIRARLADRTGGAVSWGRRAGGIAVLAMAAALLLWLRAPVTPLTEALHADVWHSEQPTAHVSLTYMGEGALGGTGEQPRIEWRTGTVQVEVEPNQGVALSVQTREALVQVIGTGFSVGRSALGTAVRVSHGRVSVDCEDGTSVLLGAGEHQLCLPTRAAGLLGRARALAEQGAAPEDVLAAAERGLAAGPDEAVRGELEVAQMEAYAAAQRWNEAYDLAGRALAAGGGARAEELKHLHAWYGLQAHGCAAATAPLRELRAGGLATAFEQVTLAGCVSGSEPAEARQLLRAALAAGVPDAQRPLIQQQLDALGGR
jgi:ferric-dicitrate binding protein FerR (iron transport regulator)